MDVRWRAFELRPDPVPVSDPNSEYVQMAWIRSVQPLAAKLGVGMRMPNVRPRTRLAHEAAAWARHHRKFEEMHEAIFRAYFERSEDVGGIDVLANLASTIGLDGAALRTCLNDHTHLQEVLDEESLAREYGLSGVPAFVAGNRALIGVQTQKSLEQFLCL